MGVIQRQVIKNNIVAVVGVCIGVLSNLFIYPLIPEFKGFVEGVVRGAQLILPFLILGLSTVMIRFYPYIKEKKEKIMAGRLLSWALVLVTIAMVVFGIGWWAFGIDAIQSWSALQADSPFFTAPWLVFAVVVSLVYVSIFTANLTNYKRIAIPLVFNNLLLKICVPLLVVYLLVYEVPESSLYLPLAVIYFLPVLGLILYSWKQGFLNLNLGRLTSDRKLKGEMLSVAGFSILGTIGSRLAVNIDLISVSSVIGNFEAGVYALSTFIMGVIAIPNTAVNSISAPIVAQAWKDKDMDQLSFLYKETSSVLFAIGGLIYVGTIVCLPYLYELLDSLGQYRIGYISVVLLGGAQLFDLLTSINGNLISMSEHYRWNVVFTVILGLLAVFLNYLFIAVFKLGMTGVALGTFSAVLLYNLLKVGFIYWKIGIQPLSRSTVYTLFLLTGAGLVAYSLPHIGSAALEILIRGGVIVLLLSAYFRFTNGVPALRRAMTGGFKQLLK